MNTRRIAVIGSGIAGLSAAWKLAAKNHVTLYEAGSYLGGHTHTVDVTLEGQTAPVDTGFLVFNDRTYPGLIRSFEELGVQWVESDMSFSVRVESTGLEWAGANLSTVFAQRRNLVNGDFLGMLRDVLRFNRETTALASRHAPMRGSLGQFLDERGYGPAFRDWYLLPMSAAIWSCPARQMLDFPLATFVRFCRNHGLLQIFNRPRWRTVAGGGREYVKRMAAAVQEIHLDTPVRRVRRHSSHAEVTTACGAVARFDHVVLACHPDQAALLLADIAPSEQALLACIRYQPNRAVLHTDERLLPRDPAVWSAWNYLSPGDADGDSQVSVSYLINRLQPLPFRTPVIVTLNPSVEPDAAKVIAEYEYDHPIFDLKAIEAQRRFPLIQGLRRTWYAGAWLGYGFHEDGHTSGLAVAEGIDALAAGVQEREREAA